MKRLAVVSLDSSLAAIPLEDWLSEISGVPKAEITWEVNDCGEGGDGRQAPTCVEATVPLRADSSAHLSLAVADISGKKVGPSIWDLSVGAGYSFRGFRTLGDWATQVRAHHR